MHLIYQVPGIKVGCTKDIVSRMIDQNLTEVGIIEMRNDLTDQEAGDIEHHWAAHFGYTLGNHYANAMKARSVSGLKHGSPNGLKTTALGKNPIMNHTPERQSELGKIGALKSNTTKMTCPHCKTEGKGNIMVRWHFDNCRMRSQQ